MADENYNNISHNYNKLILLKKKYIFFNLNILLALNYIHFFLESNYYDSQSTIYRLKK